MLVSVAQRGLLIACRNLPIIIFLHVTNFWGFAMLRKFIQKRATVALNSVDLFNITKQSLRKNTRCIIFIMKERVYYIKTSFWLVLRYCQYLIILGGHFCGENKFFAYVIFFFILLFFFGGGGGELVVN